jgi:mRNA-degrading endonuclease RelE of RelBE toxin-antitoxin system
VTWRVLYTRQAQKDARKLAAAAPALRAKAEKLLELLADDPFRQPPPY